MRQGDGDWESKTGAIDPMRTGLSAGELHVWCAALPVRHEQLSRFAALLSPDEAERAGRYAVDPARRQFVAARGMLRELLGHYCERSPSALQFRYSATGRPALVDAPPAFDFNVSHSNGVALFAISRTGPVGVDVEAVDLRPDAQRAIRSCLADEERVVVDREAEPETSRRLAVLWTCKEALLKASGWGMRVPPERIVVRFTGRDTARFESRDPRLHGEDWRAQVLEPRGGFSAAVCVRYVPARLRFMNWPPGWSVVGQEEFGVD